MTILIVSVVGFDIEKRMMNRSYWYSFQSPGGAPGRCGGCVVCRAGAGTRHVAAYARASGTRAVPGARRRRGARVTPADARNKQHAGVTSTDTTTKKKKQHAPCEVGRLK